MAKTRQRSIWQHKTSLFRRVAAEFGRDEKLLAALPRLALSDPDPSVRRAALSRCADLAVAQEASYTETDPENRTHARALYFSLMAGTHEQAPSLATRQRLVHVQTDRALILHVAIYSPEQGLRELAQQRLEGDRCEGTREVIADLGLSDPIFNKLRSRVVLRRAIVTAACEIERALAADNADSALSWTDALERFVGDWPARWPLPHYVARVSGLLQQAWFKPPAPPLTPPPLQDTYFPPLRFNLPHSATHPT
ncbi:hypothetical protein Y882_00980 [Dyella japonica DSM 16301]|uniref:Uncharacterized protein n=1 Tax=Dyella japonica DSM 16301 TaxID=1440762 RepID=A0A0G9H9S1_9GAMM|nr:hypothetical protein Y882_00980 [Dyella japonica DSM 16301]